MSQIPIKKLQILNESGVLYENTYLNGAAMRCIRTGDCKDLERFLQNNPDYFERASLAYAEQEWLRKALPFEIPRQEDFTGNIPIGLINGKGGTFRLSEIDLDKVTCLSSAQSGTGKTVLIHKLGASCRLGKSSPGYNHLGAFEPKLCQYRHHI